jgi:antibiotic biosynthesis monooxygenase (ABM) superfamily enzyme
MNLQITYQGKTAGGLLKTAEVAQSQAGCWDVFITLPNGETATAWIHSNDREMLLVQDGEYRYLQLSDQAYYKLRGMLAKADRKNWIAAQ